MNVGKSKEARAFLAVVVAQVSVNLGAALGKELFGELGPEGVAALRTGIAAVILAALFRPWRACLGGAELGWLGLYGLALGGMNLLIYWAFERLPIGVAVGIEICGPVAVVLITSRTLRDLVWLALAIVGILLLVPWPGAAAKLDATGMVFAAGAAACWAIYIVIGKHVSTLGSRNAVSIGLAFSCLVTFPAAGMVGLRGAFQPEVLGLAFCVALLSSALPYLLEMQALSQLTSRAFGLVTSSAPAIAALVGFVVLGEKLTLIQWTAIGLLIGASAGCTLSQGRSQPHPPANH